MPDQKPDRKRRSIIELLLQKMRLRQPEQPERSYFERSNRDDKRPERKPTVVRRFTTWDDILKRLQPARPSTLGRRQGMARKAFDTESGFAEFRDESIIRSHIKSEEGRIAARAVLADAKNAQEKALKDYLDKLDGVNDLWRRIDLTKPVPAELSVHLNGMAETIRADFRQTRDRIDRDLLAAYSQISATGIKVKFWTVKPGITFEAQKQLIDLTRPAVFRQAASSPFYRERPIADFFFNQAANPSSETKPDMAGQPDAVEPAPGMTTPEEGADAPPVDWASHFQETGRHRTDAQQPDVDDSGHKPKP